MTTSQNMVLTSLVLTIFMFVLGFFYLLLGRSLAHDWQLAFRKAQNSSGPQVTRLYSWNRTFSSSFCYPEGREPLHGINITLKALLGAFQLHSKKEKSNRSNTGQWQFWQMYLLRPVARVCSGPAHLTLAGREGGVYLSRPLNHHLFKNGHTSFKMTSKALQFEESVYK